MAPEEEISYSFFKSNTMDAIHIGTSKLRTGTFVGIPYFFEYKTTDDVEKERLKIGAQEITWDSDAANSLIDSLVLSNDAKSFAIFREIYAANTNSVLLFSLFKGGIVYSTYLTGKLLSHRQEWIYYLKPWARVVFYGVIGVALSLVYIGISDIYSCWNDKNMDTSAIKQGINIINGGIEYYDKQLQRNVALRHLMGGEGPPLYEVTGNFVQSIRRQHLELTSRKRFLVNELEKLKVPEKE